MDKVLRQFIEVAALKNVTKAAQKLCMNQSTLSINIRRLEESLGVPLLERSSSGVELTEFGQVVLEQARITQRLHDNTLMKIEFLKERLERELKVGTGHAEWHLFVRQSLRTYRQRHPSANIHTELGNHLRLMDQLLSGRITSYNVCYTKLLRNNGYEYGLALLAISVALVFNGGGRLSLDRRLSNGRTPA